MAKKLKFLKLKLKDWNRDVFGHLDTKLAVYVDKVKVLDANEKFQSFTCAKRFERLEVKKELSLVRIGSIFWR